MSCMLQHLHETHSGWSVLIMKTLWVRCKWDMQRMCRRHSRLTLHAGLIAVSDSQTAPQALKMSLWNLCVRKLPIIPSIFRKSKVWWFVKWGEEGGLCFLWSTDEFQKHALLSYISEQGESQVFKCRQVNDVLSYCVFPSARRWTRMVSVNKLDKIGPVFHIKWIKTADRLIC